MKFLLSLILAMVIIPSIVYGIDAKVETVEGDVFQIRDFSMDGRRTFSIDQGGGIGRIDWKEITSFEAIEESSLKARDWHFQGG